MALKKVEQRREKVEKEMKKKIKKAIKRKKYFNHPTFFKKRLLTQNEIADNCSSSRPTVQRDMKFILQKEMLRTPRDVRRLSTVREKRRFMRWKRLAWCDNGQHGVIK